MTTTTPPPEVRTRRRPRPDDATPPPRPARRRTAPPPASAEAVTNGAVKKKAAKNGAVKKGAVKNGAVTSTGRPVRRTAVAAKPSPNAAPRRSVRLAAPPRAPFVVLVLGLLGGALVSLLLLNTVLAQDAFTLSELQRGNQQLNERKQALQEDISREGSPAVLYAKARSLGMKDVERPAFIDARTGRVTEGGARPPGVPDEAVAAAAAAGVTGAPGAIVPPTGGAGRRSDGGTGGGTR
jgi:hypothetical protein